MQKSAHRYLKTASRLLFATAAFTLFAVKASQGIFNIMQRTTQGAIVVDDFTKSWGRLQDALSERFAVRAAPWIDNLIKLMDKVAENKGQLDFVVNGVIGLTILATLGGIAAAGGALGNLGGGIVALVLNALGITGGGGAGAAILSSALGTAAAGQVTLGAATATAAGGAGALGTIASIILPIAAVLVFHWTLQHLFGDVDIAKGIKDFISKGTNQTFGLEPTALMRAQGIQGIDYLSQGGAGDVMALPGTTALTGLDVTVNMYDTKINADDPDDVGEKIVTPLGEKIIDIVGTGLIN